MNPEYTDRFLATARPPATDLSSGDPQTVLLHAAYDAIIRGDFDTLGESLAEDVESTICGFPAINGNWRGRSEQVQLRTNTSSALSLTF